MLKLEIFNENDTFSKTTKIGSDVDRLNARLKALFYQVSLKDCRVLDLGCHNGRWMYAAIKMGASSVTGVDMGSNYIDSAIDNLSRYPSLEGKWDCVCQDMLEFLRNSIVRFDVIFCMGILYHTLDQYEILKECHRLNPKLLILDVTVMEDLALEGIIPSRFCEPEYTWSLIKKRPILKDWEMIPTAKMIEVWLNQAGFNYNKIDVPIDENRVGYHCCTRQDIN